MYQSFVDVEVAAVQLVAAAAVVDRLNHPVVVVEHDERMVPEVGNTFDSVVQQLRRGVRAVIVVELEELRWSDGGEVSESVEGNVVESVAVHHRLIFYVLSVVVVVEVQQVVPVVVEASVVEVPAAGEALAVVVVAAAHVEFAESVVDVAQHFVAGTAAGDAPHFAADIVVVGGVRLFAADIVQHCVVDSAVVADVQHFVVDSVVAAVDARYSVVGIVVDFLGEFDAEQPAAAVVVVADVQLG